jgi:hypothetical protein
MKRCGLARILSATRYALPVALLSVFMFSSQTKAEDTTRSREAYSHGQQVFIVNDYRYEPGDSGGDPDLGHALCSTRCNAMTFDYRNAIDPGGYRVLLIAKDRKLTVDTGSPFLGGQCVCTADEYSILRNEFNWQNKKK